MLIILKAKFGSIHFTTDCLISLFIPKSPFPGKRRDLLVDRIFNGIYLGKQREKSKYQGLMVLSVNALLSLGLSSH